MTKSMNWMPVDRKVGEQQRSSATKMDTGRRTVEKAIEDDADEDEALGVEVELGLGRAVRIRHGRRRAGGGEAKARRRGGRSAGGPGLMYPPCGGCADFSAGIFARVAVT